MTHFTRENILPERLYMLETVSHDNFILCGTCILNDLDAIKSGMVIPEEGTFMTQTTELYLNMIKEDITDKSHTCSGCDIQTEYDDD